MNEFANAEHNRLLNANNGNTGYALIDACEQIAALTDQVDALKSRAEAADRRITELIEQADSSYAPYRERVAEARKEVNQLSAALARAREEADAIYQAGQRDAKLALALYSENQQIKHALGKNNLAITLRGGMEIWGIEFVQWLERRLDTLPGLERVGKSVTDEFIYIHMETKTVFIQAV